MAQQNLLAAADAAARHPDRARRARRRRRGDGRLARRRRGHVHPLRRRRSASTRRLRGSPATRSGTSPTPRPSSTRCCCTSPTSTSTASRWSSRRTWCWPCTCAPTRSRDEQKARNFAYYERLTVRDSSLSACAQAVIAAEIGHLDLAYDYLAEAALMDLDDLEHNTTRRPAHRLAGRRRIALVAGFGGHARHRRRTQLRTPAAARPDPARVQVGPGGANPAR